MEKKRPRKMWYLAGTVFIVLAGWCILTLYVEQRGPAKTWSFGAQQSGHNALVIFDPDPFYNLDEQVCASFANALSENNFHVDVQTVAMAESATIKKEYDLFVYCANTYNWAPDWAVTDFIKSHTGNHRNKLIVAITLGAGSTATSQKNLEQVIVDSNGNLLSSYSLWLWRPNDDTKMEEPNVEIAVNMAREWGGIIGQQLN